MKYFFIAIVSLVFLASCSENVAYYSIEIAGNSANVKIEYSFDNKNITTENTSLPWKYEFESVYGMLSDNDYENITFAYFKATNYDNYENRIMITLYRNNSIVKQVYSTFEDGSSAEGLIGNRAVLSDPKYIFPHQN